MQLILYNNFEQKKTKQKINQLVMIFFSTNNLICDLGTNYFFFVGIIQEMMYSVASSVTET